MIIRQAAHVAKKKFDLLKYQFKKRFKLLDPVIIYPYLSYGYKGKIFLKGRVLEKEKIIHGNPEEDSKWSKIWRLFKRYESDEVPYAPLRITFKDKSLDAKTDDEGYYSVNFKFDTSKLNPWEKVHFTLLENPAEPGKEVTAVGEIMIPPKNSKFGIISDVDDTIIQSYALKPLKKIKTLATQTAETRVAFPGVASFYKALTQTSERDSFLNPMWFISGSSWNLYDLLLTFCKVKKIPKAPFSLKRLGISPNQWVKTSTVAYKMAEIKPVIDLMEPLPFILIGDSGQQDPEIYKRVVEEYPGRIKAIYIRDVTENKRDSEVKKIQAELKEKGVDMILAANSFEAARHAFKNDWITESDLHKIEKEVKKELKQKK